MTIYLNLPTCTVCKKSFESIRQLCGHMRMHGKSKGKFSKPRKKKKYPEFTCLNCGCSKKYNPKNRKGKFCSIKCRDNYLWETEGKLKVVLGKGGNIERYLEEEFGHKCSKCNSEYWQGKKIPLRIGFRDGNKKNKDLSNLMLVCYNCFYSA